MESFGTVVISCWDESCIADAMSPLAVGVLYGGTQDVGAKVISVGALWSGESISADAVWWAIGIGIWSAIRIGIDPPASEWSDWVSCIVEWSPACPEFAVGSGTSR